MATTVKKINNTSMLPPGPKRVAAYARVSSDKDAMLHSLSAQVSYYSGMIQSHRGWQYVGVYADEGITGTTEARPAFQRLLEDCRAGLVDMVITKSISRFARNTVTLLQTVRDLKARGVDVFFEKENIHSTSGDGELMLTILASYAQEESRSASENQKWRVKKNFENGMPWNGTMLGYRYEHGALVVQPEEAVTVRGIFEDYLSGMGVNAIAKKLNAAGIPTRRGNTWGPSSVMRLLLNSDYTGNLVLQKTFCEDHITKRKVPNEGQRAKYIVQGSHEAIITQEQFDAVQAELRRRSERFAHKAWNRQPYPFTSKLVCAKCGKMYKRKTTTSGVKWACPTWDRLGRGACPAKMVPEDTLTLVSAAALGLAEFDEETFRDKVALIRVEDGNKLEFRFKDGSLRVMSWPDRCRASSWTPEMRAEAGRKTKERWRKAHGERS